MTIYKDYCVVYQDLIDGSLITTNIKATSFKNAELIALDTSQSKTLTEVLKVFKYKQTSVLHNIH